MTEILVYYGKHGDVYWDATDRKKAYLALFKFLDETMEFYEDLKDIESIKNDIHEGEEALAELEKNIPDKNNILFGSRQRDIEHIKSELSWNRGLIEQATLYIQAKNGSVGSINLLISRRIDNEYERWSIERIEDV